MTVRHPFRLNGRFLLAVRLIPLAVGMGLLSAQAAGCGRRVDPERIRQEVLKTDPDFAKVLEQRDELANKITQLQRELALKQSQVERQIAQLRQELSEVRQQVTQKIQHAKASLDPERKRVELALAMAAEELKSKRTQRASAGRAISRLRKALKANSSGWTPSERSDMDHELQEYLHEAKRLDAEIVSLAAHSRLLKSKSALLKL